MLAVPLRLPDARLQAYCGGMVRAWPDIALAASCGIVAFGLRRIAARLMAFDGRYGQDAYAYDEQARALLRAWRTGRRPPRFFWPQGYPALAALVMLARKEAPDSAQWASAAAGGLTAAVTYLLARDVAAALPATSAAQARAGGLLAGLTLAVAALPLRAGVVAMADATALAWSTLAVWSGLHYSRSGQSRWLLFCAGALALAIQTRWLNATLALPLGLVLKRHSDWRRRAGAGLFGSLLLLPQALITAGNPDPLLRHDWLQRWSIRNSLRRRLSNVDGHYRYRLPTALFYALPLAHPAGLTPWLTPLLAVGILRLAAAGCWPELGLTLGWVGVQYGFLAGVPYQNFRYSLGYLTPLATLVGCGAATAPARLAGSLGLAALATMLGWSIRDLRKLQALDHPYRAVADWAGGLAPGATLICFGPTATVRCRLAENQPLQVVELYYQTPERLAGLIASAEPVYLALDMANLRSQWHGYGPELLVGWLEAHCWLTPVASFAPFSVFELQRKAV